jgi:hypothetical protein
MLVARIVENKMIKIWIFFLLTVLMDAFWARGLASTFIFLWYGASVFRKKENINRRKILVISFSSVISATVLGYSGAWITAAEWEKIDQTCFTNLDDYKTVFMEKNRCCMSSIARWSVLGYSPNDKVLVYLKFPMTRVYLNLITMESSSLSD